jgi:hypothetical protein
MVAREGQDQAARPSAHGPATFELERFVWAAPDRLELTGRFRGLGHVPESRPHLVIDGPEHAYRLDAPYDSPAPPVDDGTPWSAEFVWQEPPVAFDVATLELGDGILVELPAPGTKRRRIRGQTLKVQTATNAARAEAHEFEWAEPAAPRGADDEEPTAARATERVGLEAELLAAREEVRELRAAAERTQKELARARDDLHRERERHAGAADRFREGLKRIRASASDAVETEHRALEQMGSALGETRVAIEAKDAELDELRRRLEEEEAARTQAESEARAAAQAHQAHLAELDEARRTAGEARAGAEEMLKRLEAIRDALGDGD